MELTSKQESLILDGARDAIRQSLGVGRGDEPRAVLSPEDEAALTQPAGCFVSLHRRNTHALRGCIGRIEATQPLIDAVRHAAAAVLRDPRFEDQPVTGMELPYLEIEVSLLGPLRAAPTPLDFDPPREGVVLQVNGRSGVFLPQVARETGWTREQLLTRLCTEKLGLPGSCWQRPDAQLSTFATRVIGPVAFEPAGSE